MFGIKYNVSIFKLHKRDRCVCVHSCILNMHIILWVCVYICGMYDILGMHGMYLYLYAFICVLMPMYHNMCKHYAKYVYVCTFFTHVLYLFMHNIYQTYVYYVTVSAVYSVDIHSNCEYLEDHTKSVLLIRGTCDQYWLT